MSGQYVTLSDRAKLFVKLLGVDGKTKPLLIVLHGAPGLSSHEEPESSFGFLQSRFRVLVYDARGSGTSDEKAPYTDERWVEDVDELRAWVGDEKFILAGGSYGGFIALQYILKFPQRVLALITRDTWTCGPLGTLSVLKTILMSKRIRPDPERQVRCWSGNLRDDEDFTQAYLEIVPMFAPEPLSGENSITQSFEGEKAGSRLEKIHAATQNFAFSYNVPRFDVRSKLKEIKAPTLIVQGRLDLIVPVEEGQKLGDGIPNAQLAIFEHSGHSPPSDEPQAFQDRVWEFLSPFY